MTACPCVCLHSPLLWLQRRHINHHTTSCLLLLPSLVLRLWACPVLSSLLKDRHSSTASRFDLLAIDASCSLTRLS